MNKQTLLFDDKEERNTALYRCPLFDGLRESDIKKALLLTDAHKASYKRGDYVLRSGIDMTCFGLVLSGSVQVCTDDINGDVAIMANVVAGDTFGESLCFLRKKNISVYARAFSDTDILWMDTVAFTAEEINSDSLTSKLFLRFTSMLASRALAMNDRIQILSKKSIEEKLNEYFTQCVRDQKSKILSLTLSREGLAAYLGTDRSALSRTMSLMKKNGKIDYYKNTVKLL